MILMEKHNHRVVFSVMCKNYMLKLILCTFAEAYTGKLFITRQKYKSKNPNYSISSS